MPTTQCRRSTQEACMAVNMKLSYHFNCILVIIWPVVTLLDLSYGIVSACTARKISGVPFLKNPRFLVFCITNRFNDEPSLLLSIQNRQSVWSSYSKFLQNFRKISFSFLENPAGYFWLLTYSKIFLYFVESILPTFSVFPAKIHSISRLASMI